MDLTTDSRRQTARLIAERVPCSVYLVRRFADSGHLTSVKDYNGWRIFPDPEQTIRQLRKLLVISESQTEKAKEGHDNEAS